MCMSFRQGISHLGDKAELFSEVECLTFGSFVKCLPLDVLHDDESVFICFAHFVNSADVWMIKFGSCPCFFEETALSVFIGDRPGGQDLNGYFALKLRVLCLIHLAHTALSYFRADFVTA